MTDKRQTLRELGWSDEIITAMLGGFADTPLDVEIEDLPTMPLVSTSDFFVEIDAAAGNETTITAK